MRQIIFEQIGPKRQAMLAAATVGVVGCGALGSCAAELLCRAGVGSLVLIDRDYIEEHNLARQTLYTEKDLLRMKADVCREKLLAINSSLSVVSHVVDLTSRNIDLLQECDVVVDCSDNFSVRFLLNDYCKREKKPWVFSSVVGSQGFVYPVLSRGACFSCIFSEPTALLGSCDTEGVIATAPPLISSMQVTEVLKILTKQLPVRSLLHYDIWKQKLRLTKVSRRADCLACKKEYRYLSKEPEIVSLCGRGMYQIHAKNSFDLAEIASRLGEDARVTAHCVFFGPLSVFSDGRVFVRAATKERAQSLCAQYLG